MDEVVTLDNLEVMIQILSKLYDLVRMVDPSKRKIILFSHEKQPKLKYENAQCYSLWHEGKSCVNCISARALHEKQAIVKIEYEQGQVFMINALPVEFEGQNIVIEMFKDITESGIIDIKATINDAGKIESVINRRNQAIVQDDLTKVYNKRFINERLPFEIVQSLANRSAVTVIMTDIDDFKTVNDTYGHICGDYVLKGFAKLLKMYTRKNVDWVARFGGDEFLIFLSETDLAYGHKIAERMRKKIASTTVTYEGQEIHLTGSFGVYSLFDEDITAEKLIERADYLLYKSKEGGKNRVSSVFSATLPNN